MHFKHCLVLHSIVIQLTSNPIQIFTKNPCNRYSKIQFILLFVLKQTSSVQWQIHLHTVKKKENCVCVDLFISPLTERFYLNHLSNYMLETELTQHCVYSIASSLFSGKTIDSNFQVQKSNILIDKIKWNNFIFFPP